MECRMWKCGGKGVGVWDDDAPPGEGMRTSVASSRPLVALCSSLIAEPCTANLASSGSVGSGSSACRGVENLHNPHNDIS